jgi:uncharacterized protein YjbI with pentapeptide repeats
MARNDVSKDKASTIPPRFAGERVVFAGKIDWKDEAEATVAAEGGKVLPKLDPTVTMLVAGEGSRAAQKQLAQWSSSGKGSTRVYDERAFLEFLAPTRQEALTLLRQGKKGVMRWHRLVLSEYPALDTLITVDLSGASLVGAQLAKAELKASKLDRADLRDADLTEADLGIDMKQTNFAGARLDKANVGELVNCNLASASLRGATLCNGARRSDFSNADMRGIQAAYVDLKGNVLHGANLEGADLEEAELQGADLRDANLSKAKMTEANLRKANLARAKLVGADLGGADLSGADLSNADLSNAVLTTVKLAGAKIDGARFDGAKLAGTKLPGVATGESKSARATKAGIGPNLRKLESVARRAQRLKSLAKLELADGRLELSVSVDAHGWVALQACRYQGGALAEEVEAREVQYGVARGISKVAARFAHRSARIKGVTATSHRSPVVGSELKDLVTRAWSEALGIDVGA